MAQDVLPNSAADLTTTTQEAAPTSTEKDDFVFKRILVPIDFSEHSKKTASFAMNLASRDNAMYNFCTFFRYLTMW